MGNFNIDGIAGVVVRHLNKIIFIVVMVFVTGCSDTSKQGVGESDEMKAAQIALSAGDYEKAYELYNEADKKYNDPLAQFTLGNFFRNGWGRAPDPATACQWFGKSAQDGTPFAQHLYGECLELGVHQKADPLAAAHWYTEAVKGGHLASNCNLGQLYMVGAGVDKNPKKALELCAGAAASSTIAMLWMGLFYLEGDASIKNDAQAWLWFKQAAEYRQPEGFYYLGLMLEKGLVDNSSAEAALGMYEQAAAKAYIKAYYPTGRLYFESRRNPESSLPVAEDLAKAYMWLAAAKRKAEDGAQLKSAEAFLQEVLKIMPETWIKELDERVDKHLKENHS